MFYPAHVAILSYFYPLGNTPATSLTAQLPPDLPARALCLGCGDARNVLFTAYCEAGRAGGRPIDVTSCDLQRAVIARNVLLFSLIIADQHGENQHAVWNLYYHLFLDDSCLALLQAHAKELLDASPSLDEWHQRPYGRLLRFCDSVTLAQVRGVWASYVDADARPSKAEFERAKQAKKTHGRDGNVLSAARSAAPFTLDAVKDAPLLFEQYWDRGTTAGPDDTANPDLPNPMFSGEMDDLTLHYGTDPILGFHLATAYAPLAASSPLNPSLAEAHGPRPAVKAARQQFAAWCSAFRQCSAHFTLRFFVGEALTLCHVLQQKLTAGGEFSAQWYRGPYMPDPLILDSDDYTSGQAPLAFNVIDTSNLVDHFGSINLLVATAPLLDGSLAANLVTESLLRRHHNGQPPMDGLLCGNFNALSILLGLFPVQYWTNTSLIAPVHEIMLLTFQKSGGRDDATQLHGRVTWKNRVPSENTGDISLQYDEKDLAQLLYQTYLVMFEGEDPEVLMQKRSARHVSNVSLPYYTRASYAALLRLVKSRVEADWNKTIEILLDLIDNDTTLMLGRNHLQELRVQMHLFGVSSDLMPDLPLKQLARNHPASSQLAWSSVPDIVSVTLKIPRSKLRVFNEVERSQLGTPPLNCHIVTPNARASFAAIQLAFGKEEISGDKNTEHFTLKIQQDNRGWSGESPLWVSFLAPTAVLLNEPQDLSLQFTLQPTPYTVSAFVTKLDDDLSLFKTNLGDTAHVFITRCRPNITAVPSVMSPTKSSRVEDSTTLADVRTTVSANFTPGTTRISNLTGRLDLTADDLKSKLSSGAAVDTIQVSPCVIAVKIGTSTLRPQLHFPVPVLKSQNKVRVARKSSYIEVIVPIATPSMKHYFPEFILPAFPGPTGPITWGVSHLPLSRLPIIDATANSDKQWLITHNSSMWSARERTVRDSTLSGSTTHVETRNSLKDSLFSIFGHFADTPGVPQRTRFFGLANDAAGGVHILLFADSLRLDLANHSVVLDAACLPLTRAAVRALAPSLDALHRSTDGLCKVNLDAAELRAWKAALPAMAERARVRPHAPDCAYGAGSVPVSFADGASPLCACANGVFPDAFLADVDVWPRFKPFAVRVAVAPVFSAPLAEAQQAFGPPDAWPREMEAEDACGVCGRGEKVGGGELLRCSRCKRVRYCSPECQRKAWKTHKGGCVAVGG